MKGVYSYSRSKNQGHGERLGRGTVSKLAKLGFCLTITRIYISK